VARDGKVSLAGLPMPAAEILSGRSVRIRIERVRGER
jgi:hypothetical protein